MREHPNISVASIFAAHPYTPNIGRIAQGDECLLGRSMPSLEGTKYKREDISRLKETAHKYHESDAKACTKTIQQMNDLLNQRCQELKSQNGHIVINRSNHSFGDYYCNELYNFIRTVEFFEMQNYRNIHEILNIFDSLELQCQLYPKAIITDLQIDEDLYKIEHLLAKHEDLYGSIVEAMEDFERIGIVEFVEEDE